MALALLLAGLALGVLGLLGQNADLWACGVFSVLTAVPLLFLRAVHNAQQLSEDQLAEAERAGYRRALEHVARGLLDGDHPPSPGHRATEQDAGNVIHMRCPSTQHRKAQ
ncbi:hypothetical protein ACFC63_07820 [Streptomyces albidoflavus]